MSSLEEGGLLESKRKDAKKKDNSKTVPQAEDKLVKAVKRTWSGTPATTDKAHQGYFPKTMAHSDSKKRIAQPSPDLQKKTSPSPSRSSGGFLRRGQTDPDLGRDKLDAPARRKSQPNSDAANAPLEAPAVRGAVTQASSTQQRKGENQDGYIAGFLQTPAGNGLAAARAMKATNAELSEGNGFHDLEGIWMLEEELIGTIAGCSLIWSDGRETVLSRQGDDIIMELDGEQYIGNAGLTQGEIHWSDGDVWQKQLQQLPADSAANAGKTGELGTDLQSLKTPSERKKDSEDGGLPAKDQPPAQSDTKIHAGQPYTPLAVPAVPAFPATEECMGSDFEGEWKLEGEIIGSITGSLMIWSDGRETVLSRQGDDIIMELDGEQYIGNAGLAKGEIYWNDGDVWQKESGMGAAKASDDGELATVLTTQSDTKNCSEKPQGDQAVPSLSGHVASPIPAAPAAPAIEEFTMVDIQGDWKLEGERIGTITGSRLVWSDGEETSLSRQGDDIFMEVCGEQYTGNAGLAEGEIHWSDGDVWQKMAKELSAAEAVGLAADLQSLETPEYNSEDETPPAEVQVSAPSGTNAHSGMALPESAVTNPSEFLIPAPVPEAPEVFTPSLREDSIMADIEGDYKLEGEKIATIRGCRIIWADGTKTPLSRNGDEIFMEVAGEQYTGDAGFFREIHWNDGDVWQKDGDSEDGEDVADEAPAHLDTKIHTGQAPAAGAATSMNSSKHAIAYPESTAAAMADIQGIWKSEGEKIATVRGSRLIWSDGEETELSRQGDDIIMEMDGEQIMGNAGLAQGEIHWSDGDIWQKEAQEPSVGAEAKGELTADLQSLRTPSQGQENGGDEVVSTKDQASALSETQNETGQALVESSENYLQHLQDLQHLVEASTVVPAAPAGPAALVEASTVIPAAPPGSAAPAIEECMGADIEGDWKLNGNQVGTIVGSCVIWASGNKTVFSRQGDDIFMKMGGVQCTGNAGLAEGEIYWSDGDVWQRQTQELLAAEVVDIGELKTLSSEDDGASAECQVPGQSDTMNHQGHKIASPASAAHRIEDSTIADIEGDWILEGEKIGTIIGFSLIWSDGRETLLSKQGDDIIMELDGEQYIGNAGLAQGEIHWSDGDIWRKETQEASASAPAKPDEMRELTADLQALSTPPDGEYDHEDRALRVKLEVASPGPPVPEATFAPSARATASAVPEKPVEKGGSPQSPSSSSQEPIQSALVDMAGAEAHSADEVNFSILDGSCWHHTDDGSFMAKLSQGRLFWEDASETPVFIQGRNITMNLQGEEYSGKFSSDGMQVLWSDGEIWQREIKTHEVIQEARLPDVVTKGPDAGKREDLLMELSTLKENLKELQRREMQWMQEKEDLTRANQQLRTWIGQRPDS